MSTRFTAATVSAFLAEQGCDGDRANFIANFVVTALRSVSVNAVISAQSANEDFSEYSVTVAAHDGNGFKVDYTATKLGPSFVDHRAKVVTPEVEYSVSRLIFTQYEAQEIAEVSAKVEETKAVEEELTAALHAEIAVIPDEAAVMFEKLAGEFVEEVIADEPVVEAPAEAAPVEAVEEAAAEVAAEVEAPAVEAEKPKAKKGKAKKAK